MLSSILGSAGSVATFSLFLIVLLHPSTTLAQLTPFQQQNLSACDFSAHDPSACRHVVSINSSSFCIFSRNGSVCGLIGTGRCQAGTCIFPTFNVEGDVLVQWFLIVVFSCLGGILVLGLGIYLIYKCCTVHRKKPDGDGILPHESDKGTNTIGAVRSVVQEHCDNAAVPLEGRKCCICHLRPPDCVVVPCGHTFCVTCVERRERCPSCRIDIRSTVNLTDNLASNSIHSSSFVCSSCKMRIADAGATSATVLSVITPCGHLLCTNCSSRVVDAKQCQACHGGVESVVPIVWDTVVVEPVSPLPLIPHRARRHHHSHHHDHHKHKDHHRDQI